MILGVTISSTTGINIDLNIAYPFISSFYQFGTGLFGHIDTDQITTLFEAGHAQMIKALAYLHLLMGRHRQHRRDLSSAQRYRRQSQW